MQILRMVMMRGLGLACLGILIGISAASALTQVLSRLLFGVSSGDAVMFAAVVALLMGAAVLATATPAIRATRVDPVVSLRQQ